MNFEVLVTGKLHPSAIEALGSLPQVDLVYHPDCPRAQLEDIVSTAQILVTRSETAIDSALLEKASQLKLVVRAAVGVGNIDLEAATAKGVLVTNTPGKNTNSAAEMALGLLLSMLRNLPQAHNKVREGGWDRHTFTGRELRGKRVGLVGLGNVGHRMAKFCLGLDAPVLAYDPYIAPEVFMRHGVEQVSSLRELCEKVDVLSVHVPLNRETRGMVGAEELAALPQGSFVVNAARGGVVSELALVESLGKDHLGGVALDVFEGEPKPRQELISHPRVWLAPHIGASTLEAQIAIGSSVVEQVGKFLSGSVVDYPVNLPELRVIEKPVLGAYALLAEKIGSLMAQSLRFNPSEVTLYYRGDIAELDNSLLRLSWMKGYAAKRVEDYVSVVNAKEHLQRMGIEVKEANDPAFTSYKSAIKIVVRSGHQNFTVGGVVFDERYIRISLVDQFLFEFEPSGHLLMVENDDKPGVIGRLGMVLAQHQVNISDFNLSRHPDGGRAMAMVTVDSPVSGEAMQQLREVENVTHVSAVEL